MLPMAACSAAGTPCCPLGAGEQREEGGHAARTREPETLGQAYCSVWLKYTVPMTFIF